VTVGEWLAAREPAPPAALAGRLRELLSRDDARALDADAAEAPAVLLRAGESVLGRLLREAATTRESALDLLVADALVTYAFEAAGEVPATLDARAAQAMAQIARVAAPAGA
jgi:hypothetical protein